MPSSAVAKSTSERQTSPYTRRFPIGAEVVDDRRAHLRVWAPRVSRLDVVLVSGATTALDREADGYFSGVVDARAGDRYQLRLDDRDRLFPDPASRFQPEGPHGPSEIVDPAAFQWTDAGWRGIVLEDQVFYELHIGTFTRSGTWTAAANELPELARLGITCIEVMPIAEFEGRFGWGYDGVDLFAPSHLYGAPDDFRRFVDAAHATGLGVILDVVPNHFGPVGNYLREYSASYFTDRYDNEWGDAINFDGPGSEGVREYFIANAGYWIEEFHLDGLRLDATHQIFDTSDVHILAAMGRSARAAAGERSVVLVAENERQDTRLVRPLADGGYGLDAVWNDDFHHSAMVALTGRAEAYYSDTRGDPQEFVSAAKYGYLFQGQHYHWQRQPRGTPSWGLSPARFVAFLQNHDQVANSAWGLRGDQLTSQSRWRAMTALLLLGPWTPMIFQGQEFSATTPFLYFADFDEELNAAVREGRRTFVSQFPTVANAARRGLLDDPSDVLTFERSRLDLSERARHAKTYELHRDLLRLRRSLRQLRGNERFVDGAVLSSAAFALRLFMQNRADDRVLVVNLGADLRRWSIADPLLAPPFGCDWTLEWCSEDPKYGGGGIAHVLPPDGHWWFPADSAVLLAPQPRSASTIPKCHGART